MPAWQSDPPGRLLQRQAQGLTFAIKMPLPIDSRKKPASVKVHVTSGTGVDITWSDGHASHYDFAYLRDECPCATCNDERIRKSAVAGAGPASAPALPMFKPKPQIGRAHV